MADIKLSMESKKKLKKLGLSPEIFDAEKFERDVAIYHQMCERIKLLEESDEWRDKDLPWKAEREQYKKDEAAGLIEPYQPGVEVMRPAYSDPKIVRHMRMWTNYFNAGFASAGERTLALYHRKRAALKAAEEQSVQITTQPLDSTDQTDL